MTDTPDREAAREIAGPYLLHLGDGLAVKVGGSRFDGWLFRRHPDGQWISVRKLDREDSE